MASKPTVTLTLAGDGSQLSEAFDKVGVAAKDMGSKVDSVSGDFKKVRRSADDYAEASDTAETRAQGFSDTIGGVRDGLTTLADSELSATDRLIGLGQAGADLAGGFTNFLIPAVSGLWRRLIATTAATWLVSAAQTVWTAVMGVLSTAMAALNAVIRANPILFLVGLILVLVGAFLYLWRNSEGFRNFFIGMWHGIQAVVGSVVKWIKGAWNGAVDFFSHLPQRIGQALGAIGGFFERAFKGAANLAIDAVNFMVDRINDLIYGINVISPFDDIPNIPHIPRMHTGGVVPGMPGTERLMMLQAGERVSTRGQGGGGALMVVGDADGAVATMIKKLIRDGTLRLV